MLCVVVIDGIDGLVADPGALELGWLPAALPEAVSLLLSASVCPYVSEAVREYQAALEIKPDCAEAHYNLGTNYGSRGWHDNALREFQAAVRIKPDYVTRRKTWPWLTGREGAARRPSGNGELQQS